MATGKFSWLRTCAVAIVFAAHALALALLLVPALAFAPRDSRTDRDDVLRIGLYQPNPARSVASRAAQVTRPRKQYALRAQRPRTQAVPVAATDNMQHAPANLRSTAATAATAPTTVYITHGMSPSGTSQFGRQNTDIPGGGAADPRGNRFPMVDPRSHGLAGVVRMIASWGGTINPHCLDVEAWRAMTPAELSDHHVSTETMDQTAAAYRCLPRDAVSEFIKSPSTSLSP